MLELVFPPPGHLPHIYPVLNVLLSTPVFAFTWLWSIKRSVEMSWGLSGLGFHNKPRLSTELKSVNGDSTIPEEDGLQSSAGVTTGLGLFTGSNRPGGLRTRSLGYGQGKRSTIRSSSFQPEPDS